MRTEYKLEVLKEFRGIPVGFFIRAVDDDPYNFKIIDKNGKETGDILDYFERVKMYEIGLENYPELKVIHKRIGIPADKRWQHASARRSQVVTSTISTE